MENFGKFMAILFIFFISIIFSGFVLTKLWMWFITPIFYFYPINIIQAIGLLVTINFFKTRKYEKFKQDEWEEIKKSFFNVIAKCSVALFLGWILQMLL